MTDTLYASLSVGIFGAIAAMYRQAYRIWRETVANRRVLEDRRVFVIYDEFKDDRKADRRAR